MIKARHFTAFLHVAILAATPAFAAAGKNDQPIEISSDKLDAYQDQHKAIFSGNVIAVQGTTNLRATTMTVYYRDSSDKKGAAAPKADAASGGIYRIEAQTGVVFTTPTDTATGDLGIYNVDAETIDLTGNNVTLTQGQNILKGTHVTHYMQTGRSIITSGNGKQTDVSTGTTSTGGRVHGVFFPSNDNDKKPVAAPKAGGK